MSFFSANQKELLKVLGICNQISPKRSDIDVFTYSKVTVNEKEVKISSVNTSLFYSIDLNLTTNELKEPVSFLIKTDLLFSSVALISDDTVGFDLNLEKSTLIVQGAKTKHTLRLDTQLLSDFLEFTKNDEELELVVKVDTKDIVEANKSSSISVGNPRTVYQPEFLSVCYTLDIENSRLLIVSTDRYRITKTVLKMTVETNNLEATPKNYLINPKSLGVLNTCLGEQAQLSLRFERDYLWVELDHAALVIKYSDGKYPDYEKIIPQSFACSFMVNTKSLLEALKQVYFSARSNTNNKSITVAIDPAGTKMQLTATTSDGYASESVLEITSYEGATDPWTQAFNSEYLMDYISMLTSENLLWEANPGKPSVLSPENQKEVQLYLVSGLK